MTDLTSYKENGYPFQLEYHHIDARSKQRNNCFSRRCCFVLSAVAVATAAGSNGDICDFGVGGGGGDDGDGDGDAGISISFVRNFTVFLNFVFIRFVFQVILWLI